MYLTAHHLKARDGSAGINAYFSRHSQSPEHAPNGAILPRRDTGPNANIIYSLDLVHVQDVWLPLSEAGVHTYLHSSGMRSGERWCFAIKPAEGSSTVVFDARVVEALSPVAVAEVYGASSAERARPDYPTVQLELHRRPRE